MDVDDNEIVDYRRDFFKKFLSLSIKIRIWFFLLLIIQFKFFFFIIDIFFIEN